MLNAGLQKLTLIDYPGKLAATVFLPGCNFCCPFCHNPQLVTEIERGTSDLLPWDEIFEFLKNRKKYLDGVVFTGGEPLLQPQLLDLIRPLKDLGYKIKLDTNGSNFEALKNVLEQNLVDFVAMDIKAPLLSENYCSASGLKNPQLFEVIKQTADYLLNQSENKNWDYEFRTTVVPEFMTLEDIELIAQQLHGAKRYFLQQFQNKNPMIKAEMSEVQPYSNRELLVVAQKISPHFGLCQVRNI